MSQTTFFIQRKQKRRLKGFRQGQVSSLFFRSNALLEFFLRRQSACLFVLTRMKSRLPGSNFYPQIRSYQFLFSRLSLLLQESVPSPLIHSRVLAVSQILGSITVTRTLWPHSMSPNRISPLTLSFTEAVSHPMSSFDTYADGNTNYGWTAKSIRRGGHEKNTTS